jgi:hypothetical protein
LRRVYSVGKHKKYDPKKQQRLFMVGVQSKWSTEDPLAEDRVLTDSSMSHVGARQRNELRDPEVRLRTYTGILEKCFKWRVDIKMEFDDGLNTYYKTSVMVFSGFMCQADDTWHGVVEDMFANANMLHYKTTHVTCTVLAAAPIKEADFA